MNHINRMLRLMGINYSFLYGSPPIMMVLIVLGHWFIEPESLSTKSVFMTLGLLAVLGLNVFVNLTWAVFSLTQLLVSMQRVQVCLSVCLSVLIGGWLPLCLFCLLWMLKKLSGICCHCSMLIVMIIIIQIVVMMIVVIKILLIIIIIIETIIITINN